MSSAWGGPREVQFYWPQLQTQPINKSQMYLITVQGIPSRMLNEEFLNSQFKENIAIKGYHAKSNSNNFSLSRLCRDLTSTWNEAKTGSHDYVLDETAEGRSSN